MIDTDGAKTPPIVSAIYWTGGVGSPALSYKLELLPECVLLRGKWHELFMPETHALRLVERGHRVRDRYFAHAPSAGRDYLERDSEFVD